MNSRSSNNLTSLILNMRIKYTTYPLHLPCIHCNKRFIVGQVIFSSSHLCNKRKVELEVLHNCIDNNDIVDKVISYLPKDKPRMVHLKCENPSPLKLKWLIITEKDIEIY